MRILTLLAVVLACLHAAPAQSKDLYDQGTLRTLYLTFSSSTWFADLIASRSSGVYVKGNLIVDQQLYQQVGVKMSGKASFDGTTSDKKDLEISMDAFISGQDLLGYDSLNLHNGFNDPTMLREVIGYQILRRSIPAPKANHVRVYINNVYWGLYANVQQIDKEMIDEWFKGRDGNRYRAEATQPSGKGWSALQNQGALLQPYKDAYDFKGNLSAAVKPWEDVRQLCQVLDTSTNLRRDLPAIAAVDGMLWYLAQYSALANLEGYNPRGEDYYLYHDEERGLMHIIPWDMSGAFGASAKQTVLQATDQPPFLNESNLSLPLLGKLWGQSEWRGRYIHHMRRVLDEDLSWAKISPLVTATNKLIAAALKADTKKLYTDQQASDNLTKAVSINTGTYAKTVPGLKQFCDARNVYLRGLAEFKAQAPQLSSLQLSNPSPKPAAGQTVTVKVTSTVAFGGATLYYRSTGGYIATPMFDDGKHGDGAANDGTFGAFVPTAVHTPGAEVEYYVGAQSASSVGGAVSYLPGAGQRDAASYRAQWAVGSSPVSIHEVMANNTRTHQDGAGEYDDWVELYNSAKTAVSVGGMYLSDNPLNPTKWKIPANTSIAAGGTLLVWCDEDGSQGPLHANFKLTSAGEEVNLFDTDGKTRLSRLIFPALGPDESIGRRDAGANAPLVLFRKGPGAAGTGATPNRPNEPSQGTREYFSLNGSNHRFYFQALGTLRLGTGNALRALGAPANSPVALMFGTAPAALPLGGGLELMLGGTLIGPYLFQSDASGTVVQIFQMPNDPKLVGLKLYLQAGTTDTKGFTLSNASQVIPH